LHCAGKIRVSDVSALDKSLTLNTKYKSTGKMKAGILLSFTSILFLCRLKMMRTYYRLGSYALGGAVQIKEKTTKPSTPHKSYDHLH